MSGYYNRNNRGITKKLGPVTAYADAVLAGYKGTREQWAQDMAKLGQNVTQVAQNTKLTTELAEQTRVNAEQVAKDTAEVRELAEETSDNAVQVASNTAESNRLAAETKQAAAQAKEDAEYAGAAADNFRVDTTLSEEGKAAEAKTTGEKFAQLSEEKVDKESLKLVGAGKATPSFYVAASDGSLVKNENFSASDFMSIQTLAGQNVKVKCAFVDSAGIAFYNGNNDYISGLSGSSIGGKFTECDVTVPNDAKYMRLSWCSGSGISYESCGIYSDKTAEAILDTIIKETSAIIELDKGNPQSGYISTKGGHYSSDNFACSDFIDVSSFQGMVLKCRCSIVDDASLAFYDKNKTFMLSITSNGKNKWDNVIITDIPDKAYYLRYSAHTGSIPFADSFCKIEINVGNLTNPFTFDIDVGELIEGHYIIGSNGIAAAFNGFKCTKYIDIHGFVGYNLQIISALVDGAGYAFYDEAKTFISGFDGTNYGSQKADAVRVEKIPENAYYLRMSSWLDVTPTVKREIYNRDVVKAVLKNSEDIDKNEKRLTALETTAAVPYEYAAGKILCIGDSLTSGAYYAQGWTGSSIQQNYPYYIGRMLNCEAINAGRSGWSASDWYRDYINTHEFANYDTAIIWLGTNYGCSSMPTDTEIEAFVPDTSVSAENANQALYLIEIIKTIKDANPDCFILLCGVFASKANVTSNNEVVQQIATKYGLHYVSTLDLSNSVAPELHAGIENVHFGKAGNIYIANKFAKEIRNIIAENPLLAEFGLTYRTN